MLNNPYFRILFKIIAQSPHGDAQSVWRQLCAYYCQESRSKPHFFWDKKHSQQLALAQYYAAIKVDEPHFLHYLTEHWCESLMDASAFSAVLEAFLTCYPRYISCLTDKVRLVIYPHFPFSKKHIEIFTGLYVNQLLSPNIYVLKDALILLLALPNCWLEHQQTRIIHLLASRLDDAPSPSREQVISALMTLVVRCSADLQSLAIREIFERVVLWGVIQMEMVEAIISLAGSLSEHHKRWIVNMSVQKLQSTDLTNRKVGTWILSRVASEQLDSHKQHRAQLMLKHLVFKNREGGQLRGGSLSLLSGDGHKRVIDALMQQLCSGSVDFYQTLKSFEVLVLQVNEDNRVGVMTHLWRIFSQYACPAKQAALLYLASVIVCVIGHQTKRKLLDFMLSNLSMNIQRIDSLPFKIFSLIAQALTAQQQQYCIKPFLQRFMKGNLSVRYTLCYTFHALSWPLSVQQQELLIHLINKDLSQKSVFCKKMSLESWLILYDICFTPCQRLITQYIINLAVNDPNYLVTSAYFEALSRLMAQNISDAEPILKVFFKKLAAPYSCESCIILNGLTKNFDKLSLSRQYFLMRLLLNTECAGNWEARKTHANGLIAIARHLSDQDQQKAIGQLAVGLMNPHENIRLFAIESLVQLAQSVSTDRCRQISVLMVSHLNRNGPKVKTDMMRLMGDLIFQLPLSSALNALYILIENLSTPYPVGKITANNIIRHCLNSLPPEKVADVLMDIMAPLLSIIQASCDMCRKLSAIDIVVKFFNKMERKKQNHVAYGILFNDLFEKSKSHDGHVLMLLLLSYERVMHSASTRMVHAATDLPNDVSLQVADYLAR